MSDIQNGKCFAQTAPQNEPPVIQSGSIILQAHEIGWIITGCFTLVAVAASFWLINKHLISYTNKLEQRYIVRILFMVPIYAVISFASYLFWNHSIALLLIRDCYESTVLTAFFYLLLTYLSHDPAEQKEIFRKMGLSRENDWEARRRREPVKKWMFPLSTVKWKPEDGLYFLQLMKWGVLQYCVVRPVTTLIAVILNYIGLYCDDSWSPGWGHLYITVVMSLSVTVAMYCLLQLYFSVSGLLAPQKPMLKMIAIKAVVFLTFWQATFISLLETFNVIKNTQYMTADNIATGIGALAETFEMMIFAFVHIRAFTYKPYQDHRSRTSRWRSLMHAMNFKETLRELWNGLVYMVHRAHGRETDAQARREGVLEGIFGHSRYDIDSSAKANGAPVEEKDGVRVEVEHLVRVDPTIRRGRTRPGIPTEKDVFLEHVKSDWSKRGLGRRADDRHNDSARYDCIDVDTNLEGAQAHSRQGSWWRNVYARVSGSDHHESSQDDNLTPSLERKPRSHEHRTGIGAQPLLHHESMRPDYDDPPPPSTIRSYREARERKASAGSKASSVTEHTADPPLLSAFASLDPPTMDPSSLIPIAEQNDSAVASTSGSASAHLNLSAPNPDPKSSPVTSSATLSSRRTSRSDSFLRRAFADRPGSSASTEVSSTRASMSSQSHRTQVRLTREPQPVAQGVSQARYPAVVQRPQSSTFESSSALPRVLEVDREASGFDVSEEPQRSSRLSHIRESAQHRTKSKMPAFERPSSGLRRASADIKHSNTPSPNRYTPRRDQIVLPAPLAPMAGSSRNDRRSSVPAVSVTRRVQTHSPFSGPSGAPSPSPLSHEHVSSISNSISQSSNPSSLGRIGPPDFDSSTRVQSSRRASAPLAQVPYQTPNTQGSNHGPRDVGVYSSTRKASFEPPGLAARPGDFVLEFGVLPARSGRSGAR